MENNENENSQVVPTNESKPKASEPKKNNSILIIIMALIIVGLAGYIIYTKLIQKTPEKPVDNNTEEKAENNKQEENNTEENNEQEENNTSNENNSNIEGVTYKSKDGKKTLKINKRDTNKQGEEYYPAEYNGTKLNLYFEYYDKYSSFYGDKVNGNSQCGEYFFIVNNETKELIDTKNEKYPTYLHYIGNKYYIATGNNCSGVSNLYDVNMNKLADEMIARRDGNLYAIKDNYLIKFDKDGKTVKKGTVKIDRDNSKDILLSDPIIKNGNLFSIVSSNGKVNLYDFNNDKLKELNNPYKSEICPMHSECGGNSPTMELVGNKLLIVLNPSGDQKKLFDNQVAYIYDIANNKLESVGNFLEWQENKDYGEGYFYTCDENNLYVYDRTATMIKKTDFKYQDVIESPMDSGTFALGEQFYSIIKENDEYYIQDVFSKEKYKITIDEGYKYFGTTLHYSSAGVYLNKLEITLVNQNNESNEIKYYFDMSTKTITK